MSPKKKAEQISAALTMTRQSKSMELNLATLTHPRTMKSNLATSENQSNELDGGVSESDKSVDEKAHNVYERKRKRKSRKLKYPFAKGEIADVTCGININDALQDVDEPLRKRFEHLFRWPVLKPGCAGCYHSLDSLKISHEHILKEHREKYRCKHFTGARSVMTAKGRPCLLSFRNERDCLEHEKTCDGYLVSFRRFEPKNKPFYSRK